MQSRAAGNRDSATEKVMFYIGDLFQWERFITPSIIKLFYWLVVIMVLLAGLSGLVTALGTMLLNPIAGALGAIASFAGMLVGILFARIVAGAVYQRRLSAPQELHPHQVHAGRTDDAAIMGDVALAVEHRQLQPGIVRPIASGPDDRLDPVLHEVPAERRGFLDTGRRQVIRRLHVAVEAVRARPFVDEVEQPTHFEIGKRAHVA